MHRLADDLALLLDGAGYDVTSDADGSPRLIEVKTTNGAQSAPFSITANGVRVSSARHAFRTAPLARFSEPPNKRR